MRLSILLGVVLGILACGGEQTSSTGTPPPEPGASPEPVAQPNSAPPGNPEPMGTPAAAKKPALDVPEGNLRGDAARGSVLYAQYCAICHGATGKGDGPAGAALNPRAADHSNSEYMGSLSDAHVYQVIRKGGVSVGKSPLMAPWGSVLQDQDIRDLVAFIRKLSGT
jgi:mono/diheme cytochrome c family protein